MCHGQRRTSLVALFEILVVPDWQRQPWNWVVRDQDGLCGGLFVDRTEALKFAMFENGHRPQAVIMVPGVLELDMNSKPRMSQSFMASAQERLRHVA